MTIRLRINILDWLQRSEHDDNSPLKNAPYSSENNLHGNFLTSLQQESIYYPNDEGM